MKEYLFDKDEIKIGVLSDIHSFNKPDKLLRALPLLKDCDVVLIVGDLVDGAKTEQYELLKGLLDEILPNKSIFCVSGNHDNPKRDDSNYRTFERELLLRIPYGVISVDASGAFSAKISQDISLYGLNPSYGMKKFNFANRGEQLSFLEKALESSSAKISIIMCHPPLISHNPQRGADEQAYFSPEQDKRLQSIVDSKSNVIFISGHTHVAPAIELDGEKNNIYFNDGSICPTTVKGREEKTQQGNVSVIKISQSKVSVSVLGIYSKKVLKSFE